ncbi:MAG: cupin domain-containing protein [Cyclobacteriaceae bacterium]
MAARNAAYWIKELDLIDHPEGGYYKETYRSNYKISHHEFRGERNASTAIYFLLVQDNFSAFHRIKSDELWHFYDGDPVSIFVIGKAGNLDCIKLGLNAAKGEVPQAVVSAGCWFASCVDSGGAYGLVGCTVSPGFDFQDFELADRKDLSQLFPQHTELINKFTRS